MTDGTAPAAPGSAPSPTRVLLADDHTLVRRGYGSSWTASPT